MYIKIVSLHVSTFTGRDCMNVHWKKYNFKHFCLLVLYSIYGYSVYLMFLTAKRGIFSL